MNRCAIERIEHAVAVALRRLPVTAGDRILIALSGGADSVALTHALLRLREGRRTRIPYVLSAAHLNHRLRGDESDRDERFVRELCARLGIDLTVEHAVGLDGGSNLEERARKLRYDFLSRTADRLGTRFVAVAHHADDQAETVLMRLLRGSGAAGLAAMETSGPERIVRPLLAVQRAEIGAYLKALGATWMTDSTNRSPALLRNRIRHDLIPALERDYAPRLSRRLAGLAAEMRSLDDYIAAEARRELGRRRLGPGRLALAGFGELHPALCNAVIREWLRERMGDLRQLDRGHIEGIAEFCKTGTAGSALALPRRWRLVCEYGSVVLEPGRQARREPFTVALAREGVTVAETTGFAFVGELMPPGDADCGDRFASPDPGQLEAWFDAGQVDGELVVRGFRRGDRVGPLGMTGTRKVHDLFVDRKLPRERRSTWPIVACGGEILWIPGMVRSRIALVTAATGKRLRLAAKPCASMENVSLPRI